MGTVISFPEAKDSARRVDASAFNSSPSGRVLELPRNVLLRDTIDNDDAAEIDSVDYKNNLRDLQIAQARELVTRAALILAPLGECENRVSWILEDCLGMLEEVAWNEPEGTKRPVTRASEQNQAGSEAAFLPKELLAEVLADGTHPECFCAWPR